VSFFEPPPPREEPEERPQPAWIRSPNNELGVAVPLRLVLVQTPTLALLVDQVVAYTTGFSFRLAGRSHPDAASARRRRFERVLTPRAGDMDRLLIGVEFANGRKATNLEHGPPAGDDSGPVLMGGSGSSGGGRFDFDFWLWPLPPDGRLTFVAQWAEEGIDLTRLEVEASAIRAAGEQSEPLWPELGDGGGGMTRRSFQIMWGSGKS
jgi:hypothetical protein